MKIHKKLGLGLSLFLVLGVGLFSAQKVYALPVNDESFANATYEVSAFKNNKPETVRVTIGGQKYAFADINTEDDKDNLKFYGSNSFICDQKNAPEDYGITVTGQPKKVSDNENAYPATIKLIYWTNTDEKCKDGQSNVPLEPTTINLRYNSNSPDAPLISPGSTSDLASPPAHYWINPDDISVINATIDDGSYTFTKGTSWTYKPAAGEFCPGSTGITTSDLNTIDIKNTSNLQAKIEVKLLDNNSCSSPVSASENINIDVTADPSGNPVGSNPTKTGADDEEACYASNWQLNWFVCPLITAASTSASKMYNFVEDQLKFRVEDGAKKDSLGDQKTREGVKAAWNNFRILVSGLVVVLMLVMVIGQAIGSGPFDAYTVKKMLPRLVAGVILIQLSWPIFSWVINIVDDLGRGLADIMYAPFGGSSTMTFDKVMGAFGTEAITWNWVGVGALIVFGVVAPFIVLGLILSVLVAIFAGFLALLFRKILIILALITVPVALIAWMMPNEGLRRYWKLWWDNFIKALMMFPLIVLIIAGGRIFAKIGSSQIDFVGFFIVLIGFFGPLFILPKTFKWGGSVMQMAGNAMTKAQTATLKKPKELLQARQKEWKDLRTQRSQLRMMEHGESLKKGWGRNPLMWWQRPLDLMKAGKLDPTRGLPKMGRLYRGSEMRRDATAAYIEAGEKRYQERRGASAQKWQRTVEEQIDESGANPTKDKVFQDIADGIDTHFIDYKGNRIEIKASDLTEMDQRVALDRLSRLGGAQNFRHIEKVFEQAMRSGDQHAAQNMRRFLNDNVDNLLPKMTHLYKGYASTSDASPENIAQMHGVEIEAMLAEYSHRIATGTDSRGRPVDVAAARGQLNNFLTSYTEAASDPQLRGRLEAGGLRAVTAFMEGNPAHPFLMDARTGIQGADVQSRRNKVYSDEESRRRGGPATHPLTFIDPTVSAGILTGTTLANYQTNIRDRAR